MASIYDLYVEQGSDFEQELDITGNYAGYTIRSNVIDSSNSTTAGIVEWIDDTTGIFMLSITSSESEVMSTGIGKYDVEVVSPAGKVYRLLQGRVYINGEVTV